MTIILRAVWNYLRALPGAFATGWSDFWFRPADPATLCVLRIGTGVVLLFVYVSMTPHVVSLVGPDAYIDDAAFAQIIAEEQAAGVNLPRISLWSYVRNPAVIQVFHYYFLAVLVCLTVGCFSRTANVIAWFLHLSYVHRGYTFWYGVDTILSMLLLFLMIGPCGRRYSVDRLLQLRWARQSGTAAPELLERREWTANLAIRLIQLQMCFVYFCAGISKLHGDSWWDGSAVALTFMMHDMSGQDFRWLGRVDPRLASLFSTVSVVVTLVYEVGFVFLIWNWTLRPLVLGVGVLLHVGIAIVMGLPLFSATMLIACLSFVTPEGMRWFVNALFGRTEATSDEVFRSADGLATETGHV